MMSGRVTMCPWSHSSGRGSRCAGRAGPTLDDMVNLTRIYTRTGDDGTTALGDMSRTARPTPGSPRTPTRTRRTRCSASPSRSAHSPTRSSAALTRVQNDLFDVGADLCTPVVPRPEVPAAAGRAALRRPARGATATASWSRPGQAAQLHPARRHPGRGAAAPRAHRRAPRRALHLGGAGRARRHDEPAHRDVPQPAVRPAVHPGPDGEHARGDVLWVPGENR